MISTDFANDWLLAPAPSIRWQVMGDLAGAPAPIVAAERSRVASEGWGRRLLDEQRPDGQWGDGVATPFWWSNMYTLVFLRDLGIEPTSARARTAIDRVRSHVTWGPNSATRPSSRARSSRASTAGSSHSAPISASAAIGSSIAC